jgi:3',5'-cyclic AMP phosphodiesterase CpdA
MPARYYTFTKKLDGDAHVQFFAINSDVLGANDREQVAWLDRELGKSKATWKIVYGHHPLYSHGSRPYNLRMVRHLEPLLVKHKVDLYVAGHDHMLEMLKPINGVHYVVCGAGAGPRHAYRVNWTERAYYAATLGGFCTLRISAHDLVIEFCRMKGETQFGHTLYKGRTGPF